VGGKTPNEGRVEVRAFDYGWGAICDDGFGIQVSTAKTKYRYFEKNIPRKGRSGPQSQFPHSCVCERIIYSHDRSAFSAGGNVWTDPGNI